MIKSFVRFFRVAFLIVFVFSIVPLQSVNAAAGDLTIEPNTWNIIGLDSNTPATGPFRFPIGAKVCNTTGSDMTDVVVSFYFDNGSISTDPYAGDDYINLRVGSLQTITIPTILANDCEDAFFEVEVNKVAAAFDKTREYHIVAAEGDPEEVSTPQPRELYVEHLISQNRNSVTDVELDDVSVASGGTMTLMVGNTYKIDLEGGTATQGYNQFEDFINFPNTIFQILSVETTYSADSNIPPLASPYPYLYADSCGWDNDPNSPTYRSCIESDEKAGGSNVTTTYIIKIIGGAGTTQTLNTLLYDFSGSSYHYNADFSLGTRYAYIVGPSSVTMTKSFSPKAMSPGGTSTMTIKLVNPTTQTINDANFVDPLPLDGINQLVVAGTPNVTYSGCGAGAFTPVLAGGETSISFDNGTISPNSTCTITLDVTAASDGTYVNTTDNLFIDVDGVNTDTGNNGSDTLIVASAAACTPGQTLVRWAMPVGATVPPDTGGSITVPAGVGTPGNPTTNNTGFTATAYHFPLAKQSSVSGSSSPDTTSDDASWKTYGYQGDGGYVEFAVDTRNYTNVQMSFMVYTEGVGPNALNVTYIGNGSGTAATYTVAGATLTASVWNTKNIDLSSFASTTGTTTIRISGTGANNDNSGADAYFNDVIFTGCADPVPAPTVTKSFDTDPIVVGDTSTLTITINNTASGSQALTNVSVTDVLPLGLEIASPNGLGGTCDDVGPGGVVVAVAGTDTIDVSGISLGVGASCTVIVDVLGTDSGQYNNVTGFVSSTETGTTTSYDEDAITVWAPPVIAKSFSPTSIFTTETSTLTFTITNPNTFGPLTGVGFSDSLPADLDVSDATTSECGGTNNLVVADNTPAVDTINLTGGTILANSSCSFNVTVTGTTAGQKDNTTSVVTSTEGGDGNTASASLLVQDRTPSISLTKQISSVGSSGPWSNFVVVPTSSDVWYRFIVYNSGDVTLTGINITDSDLDVSSCIFASLAPGETYYCVVGPITTDVTPGSYPNTAQSHGTYSSVEHDSSNSTATYANPELTITKSAIESYFIDETDTLNYIYVVENVDNGFDAPILGPVTVTDDKVGSVSCQLVSDVGDFDNYLDVGESVNCPATGTVAYDVQAGDVTALEVTNQAYATASGVQSNTDTVTVPLAPDLTVSKTNDTIGDTIVVNDDFHWTLEVSNSGGTATFTNGQTLLIDNLPTSGATYSLASSIATNSAGTTGTIDCSIATNILTCTANGTVTIPNGGKFSIAVTVTPTVVGSLVNPDAAGVCRADPGNLIVELNDNNNDCSNTVAVTAPNLGLAKSNGVSSVTAGGTTTYTLTVTNSGNAATSGTITIVDVLPSGLSITDGAVTEGGANAADWTCASASNVITCTSSTAIVASGGTSIFNFTVNVDAGASGTLMNKAQVGGGGDSSNPNPPTSTTAGQCTGTNAPNEGCATDSDSVISPDLGLTKSNGVTSVIAGGTTTYTLTVTNSGDADTNGTITIVDVLPSGLSITDNAGFTPAADWSCVAASDVITCTTSAVIASGGGTSAFDLTVDVDSNASGTLVNRAQVGGGGDPGNPDPPTSTTAGNCVDTDDPTKGCATDSDSVTSPDLGLAKSNGVSNVTAGGTTTYTLTATNSGDADTNGTITIVDVLPIGLSITDNAGFTPDGTNGANWSCVAASDVITCTTSAVIAASGGTSEFDLTVDVDTDAVGTLVNRAQVGGGGDPENPNPPTSTTAGACTDTDIPTKGCATDSDDVIAPDLGLAKSNGATTVVPGGTTSYTLIVTNNGDASTSGTVTVVEVPPTGLTVTALSGTGWSCVLGTLTCTRSDALTMGSSYPDITVTADVAANAVGPLLNRAQVGGGSDPENPNPPTSTTAGACTDTDTPTKGCATDSDDVVAADLSVIKLVNNASPVVGGNIVYTLTVTNDGPSDATGVEVNDLLPAGLDYVSDDGSPGAYDSVTGVWTIGNLADGVSVSLNITATVVQAGSITNIAEVTNSNQPDPDSTPNNENGQPFEDDEASVTIGGIFDPPTAIKSFSEVGLPQLEFRMVWINSSNAAAINVQIIDEIPAGTTYVSNSLTCVSPSPLNTFTSPVNATAPLETTLSSCAFDPNFGTNGRIQWEGTIGADDGNLDENSAVNELVITFRVTVDDAVNQVQNTAISATDLANGGSFTDDWDNGPSIVQSNVVVWVRSTATPSDPIERLPRELPATGFAPNAITTVGLQPAEKTYTATDVWLEIPNLGVDIPIVGVPLVQAEWDLSWLGNQAGWLDGTAFPSWQGNSALTGHVTLSNGKPGPFAKLGNLKWGDKVIVHAYGYAYVYQVRENKTIAPNNTSVLKHEEDSWLTLITCKNYNEAKDTYANRISVRAVLISVTKEQAKTSSGRER